jgi:hypothetical protein
MRLRKEGTEMFMEMFMPSTPVLLLAIAVLAVLLTLAWFVGGIPNQRMARRLRANANRTDEASPASKEPSTSKAA